MVPRPDSLGLKNICESKSTPPLSADYTNIKMKAIKYGLCNKTVTDVSTINNMEPMDALLFSTIFHRQLHFGYNERNIEPFAPENDILVACDTLGKDGDAKSYCDALKNKCNIQTGCMDMAIVPSKAAVEKIVQALNKIYGMYVMYMYVYVYVCVCLCMCCVCVCVCVCVCIKVYFYNFILL